MSIEIPNAANDNPFNSDKITRLRNIVSDQISKYIINPSSIKRYNNDSISECIGDIQDFSNHFSRYIEAEGFSDKVGEIDMEIIRVFITFSTWKTINSHLLEHHSIVGNIDSIHEKIGTIQKLLLYKLGIEDDVIDGTDPWDRIAWKIEQSKVA